MSAIIQDFVQSYSRELDFYQQVARICAEDCERMLLVNGIRGIVTHRAKRPDRLREKLYQREKRRTDKGDPPFASAADIREDVVDFAGVRIALYFPDDRTRIDTLIEKEFAIHEKRAFPTGEKDPTKRFDGYHATHYRVVLKDDGVDTRRERYLATLIEIQVASVLMHAWSEVEHDLAYKPLSGALSEDEKAILDELNGLVIAGEIALGRLQKAVEKRVSKSSSGFTNRYELSAFLYDLWEGRRPQSATEPEMGDVGALLWLLKQTEQDSPERVVEFAGDLDMRPDARPIAQQIADVILAEHEQLVPEFRDRRASSATTTLPLRASERTSEATAVGRFLERWQVIERFGRLLAEAKGRPTSHFAMTARDIDSLIPASSPARNRLSRIRGVRNEIVHGRRSRSSLDPTAAVEELDDLIASLRASKDGATRKAINDALQGEDMRKLLS